MGFHYLNINIQQHLNCLGHSRWHKAGRHYSGLKRAPLFLNIWRPSEIAPRSQNVTNCLSSSNLIKPQVPSQDELTSALGSTNCTIYKQGIMGDNRSAHVETSTGQIEYDRDLDICLTRPHQNCRVLICRLNHEHKKRISSP